MGKKIGLFVLFVLLAIALIFGYIVVAFGYGDFLRARWEIRQLPLDARAQAEEWLYRKDTKNAYSGILARANDKAIWVWGEQGLKRYSAREKPAYAMFVACDKIINVGEQTKYTIEKKVVGEVEEWKQTIKTGDYVELIFPNDGMEHTQFEEVNGYDWWIFLPQTMEAQCAR